MTEYVVKIGFSLRAHAGVVITASSDAEAIEKAKQAASAVMEATDRPEHIDFDYRDDGVIVFVDRVTDGQTEMIIENLAFEQAVRCADDPVSV